MRRLGRFLPNPGLRSHCIYRDFFEDNNELHLTKINNVPGAFISLWDYVANGGIALT
jgi:hypothetical protein